METGRYCTLAHFQLLDNFFWSPLALKFFPKLPPHHPISHPALSHPILGLFPYFPCRPLAPFFLLPFLLALLLRCQFYLLASAAACQVSFIAAALLQIRPRRLLSNVDHSAKNTHSLQIPLADQ